MSNVDVEMPDGTVIENVPDTTRRSDVLARYQKYQHQQLGVKEHTDTPVPSKFDQLNTPPSESPDLAVLDVGRAAVTGTGANVAGGLMGLATLGTNALGLTNDDPVAVIKEWQKKAYPAETELGKKVFGAVGKVAEKTVGKAKTALGEHFMEATASPLEATVAEMMPDLMMSITGFEGPAIAKQMAMRGAEEIAKDAIRAQTKTGALSTARQANFKVSPSEYGGKLGQNITSMSNAAEIEREISVHNQGRGVDLFKVNQELPDEVAVDKGIFSDRRAHWSQKYEEARKLQRMDLDEEYLHDVLDAGGEHTQLIQDFPEKDLIELEEKIAQHRGTYLQRSWSANSAVNAMNYLRESAADLMKSDKAIDRKLGMVRRDTAEAIEDRLWRQANKEGKPDMATDFQRARRKLAQLHVWEDNANFNTGYFSARGIVATRKAMKAKTDPFTDELQMYADAAGAFPKSFQDVDLKGGPRPVSVFERYMIVGATVGGLFGHFHGTGAAFGGAEGSAIGGAIAASGIAGRKLMTSDIWQRNMQGLTGDPGAIREGLMGLDEDAQFAGAVAGAESAQ